MHLSKLKLSKKSKVRVNSKSKVQSPKFELVQSTKYKVRSTKLRGHINILLVLLLCSFGCNKPSATVNQSATQTSNADTGSIGFVNGRSLSVKVYEWKLRSGCDALGLDPQTSAGNKDFEELREGIISNLVDSALVLQETEKRSLAVAPEKLAEAETKETNAMVGGERGFNDYLAKINLSRDEYREVIKGELAKEILRDDMSRDIVFTNEEIKTYYDKRANELSTSPEKKDRITLDQAAPEITKRLRAERGEKLLYDWLKQARKAADVKLYEKYRFEG